MMPLKRGAPLGRVEDEDRYSGRIMVGTDGSKASLRALAYALGLTRKQGGALTCVHARGRLNVQVGCSGTLISPSVIRQAQIETEEVVREQLAADLLAWNARAEYTAYDGNLLTVLRRAIREARPDIVVIGAAAGLKWCGPCTGPHHLIRGNACTLIIVPLFS